MLLLQAPFLLTGVAFIVIEVLLARSPDLGVQVVGRLVDLRGAVALGAIVLLACLFAALGYMTRARAVLYLSQALTMLAIAAELAFGLYIWWHTLETKKNWAQVWVRQLSIQEIATLQDRFQCCGYYDYANPVFFTVSAFCPDAATAASKQGCVRPFAQRHATPLLNILFTGTFAMTIAAMLALLASFVYAKQCSHLARAQRRRRFVVEELLKRDAAGQKK